MIIKGLKKGDRVRVKDPGLGYYVFGVVTKISPKKNVTKVLADNGDSYTFGSDNDTIEKK